MAELSGNNYSEIDSQNNKPSPNGMAPGAPATGVYGTFRTFVAACKKAFNRSNATVTSSGSATAYTLTYDVFAGYVQGEVIKFKVGTTNTGAATLSINGLAATPIVHNLTGLALDASILVAGMFATVIFDSGVFRLQEVSALDARVKATETGITTLTTNLATANVRIDTTNTNLATTNTNVTTLSTNTQTALDARVKTDLSNIKSTAKGTVASGTVTFNYTDGAYQSITLAGNVSFSLTNLPAIGGSLSVHMNYSSGTPTFPASVVWDAGGGDKSATFGGLGVTFVAGNQYRFIFEAVNGTVMGIIS